MLGAECGHGFQRIRKAFGSLIRDAVHKIDTYIIEARLACDTVAFFKIRIGMYSAERAKLIVICALQTYAESVYTCTTQLAERRFFERSGICLDGNLLDIATIENLSGMVYEALNLGGV